MLVLGLAYKADIDDVRESPSFELIELLQHRGAIVEYHDPHCPATWAGRKHDLQMTSVALTADAVRSFDCVLVATAHTAVDYALVAKHAALVIDTRDAMRPHSSVLGAKLVRA